jgi:HK97 family phage major capsid protein
MKLHEIREQRASKIQSMRAILSKAENENRSLSVDEQKTFDGLKAEIVALEEDEHRAAFIANAERSMFAEPVGDGDNFATLERRVSIMNVLRAGAEGRPLSGAEAEYHSEAERRTGRKAQGAFVPMSGIERRVNTTATAGQIVPTAHRPDLYIAPLRDALLARRLGVRVLSGLSGNLSIPKFGSGTTVAWVAENSAVPDSDMSFGSVGLSPKHAGGITEMSRQLIQQSSPDIEQLVTDDLRYMLARAIDSALIEGGGTNEPTGVLETVGTQAATLTTLSWEAVLEMVELLELENATAANWLMSTRAKTKFAATEKSANTGIYLLDGNMAGIPVYSSQQVPNAAADKGTVILGDWSQVMLGIWSEIDLLVNPYDSEAYSRGGVKVRAMATCDIAVRHPQAFAVARDVSI